MANPQTLAARGESLKAFLAARDFLFKHREDYETAYRDFRWPVLAQFNWALDYFDDYARDNAKAALWIVEENGSELKLSFAELSRRSNQVANFLRRQGVRRGDRVVVMLPNVVGHLGSDAGGDEVGRDPDSGGDAADRGRSSRPA